MAKIQITQYSNGKVEGEVEGLRFRIIDMLVTSMLQSPDLHSMVKQAVNVANEIKAEQNSEQEAVVNQMKEFIKGGNNG